MFRQKKKFIFIIFNLTNIGNHWVYKIMFSKAYDIYDVNRKINKYFKVSGVEKDYMSVVGPLEIDLVLAKMIHLKLKDDDILDGYTYGKTFTIDKNDFENQDPYELIADLAQNWEKHILREQR